MAFYLGKDADSRCDFTTVDEWAKSPRHPEDVESGEYSHFGYVTKQNQICLAKVIQADLNARELRRLLKNKYNGKKFQDKIMYLIQIGQTGESARKPDDSENILLVADSDLMKLPFPIPLTESSYDINSNSQSRWIITNKMLNAARQRCLKMYYFAKVGDWDKFLCEYAKIKVGNDGLGLKNFIMFCFCFCFFFCFFFFVSIWMSFGFVAFARIFLHVLFLTF